MPEYIKITRKSVTIFYSNGIIKCITEKDIPEYLLHLITQLLINLEE